MIYFIKLLLFKLGIIERLPVEIEQFDYDKVDFEKTERITRGEE